MNATESREIILNTTTRLLALQGAAGVGMRDIARESGVAPSVIYHYFANKDDLLKAAFDMVNTRLGLIRSQLPATNSASELLAQRIRFQIDHAEEVVAVLKYYFAYRHLYQKEAEGVLPPKAYLHMQEVLEKGIESGEFYVIDMVADAQVMTHAVNGFLLEYYPEEIADKEKDHLVQKLHQFLIRGLKGGERR